MIDALAGDLASALIAAASCWSVTEPEMLICSVPSVRLPPVATIVVLVSGANVFETVTWARASWLTFTSYRPATAFADAEAVSAVVSELVAAYALRVDESDSAPEAVRKASSLVAS